jgi:hypothetical protein
MSDRMWREAAERFLAACFRGAPDHIIRQLAAEMWAVQPLLPSARPRMKVGA